mmetsp:Transcript_8333/g.14288  ORF Transcript_8333/g.14288 Transcript_8333/m.14288 type:complete len:318 (+) Transcript_8333:825-1778(+)
MLASTSAATNGSVESSSNKKEWEVEAVESTMRCFICPSTSLLTVSVLYRSSQYIVEMRYSCCMDSPGHRSTVMSSSDLLCLLPTTKKLTACRIYLSSSQLSPRNSEGCDWIQLSTCPSPILTYSPLLKEQHSRRRRSWLKSCTLMKLKSCLNKALTSTLGTWLSLSVASNCSSTRRMSGQLRSCAIPAPASCDLLMAACMPLAPLLGMWMQLVSKGVIWRLTLSRIMGNTFCTNASSCCLKSRAGYLASTCLNPPMPPPWMEASACADDVADRPENMVLNTLRAVAATGRDLLCNELVAGLTFLCSKCTKVTVLASQ